MSIFDLGGGGEEDDVNSLAEYADLLKGQGQSKSIESAVKYIMKTEYMNQPLYMMPGYWK
jgi:protease-4